MPFQPALPPVQALSGEILTPHTFVRHRRQLRALLLHDQCWFSARDLGRLIGQPHLEERATRTLDADQLLDVVVLNAHGQPEAARLVSESGVYAALIHYYHPENRCIRRWITADVVPTLRDGQHDDERRPRRENRRGLSLLHWQGDVWMPYRPA
ncbi:phage antirepressor [Pseudomonas daroniae]|uniref:Phage antirepressor n=1 Tax=Phytopseudomonas daroniae TaxID=2487519 RepID=A0A4Q9QQU0_9GAMM|nr:MULTISPECIES: Bro-N domain-containing protein [Pseudomonas]TBU82142.1 phage antirepressor [Pseudomonas daroniae]TBU84522.1 phage antirepressor [Pseudomonas sp. FRB 228]TBU92443.1 phage antirepressor [Pseudomonas daroniae]